MKAKLIQKTKFNEETGDCGKRVYQLTHNYRGKEMDLVPRAFTPEIEFDEKTGRLTVWTADAPKGEL